MASQPIPVGAAAYGVINGKLYVAGGFAATGNTTVVHVFDPAANRWRFAAPMPEVLDGQGEDWGAVVDWVLYVVGLTWPSQSNATFAFIPSTLF